MQSDIVFQTRLRVFFLLLIISATSSANEPPPNLDFVGGYFDGDVYKCYAEPCFKIHKNSYPSANNIPFKPKDWPHWLDIDSNCQNEREQALAESSDSAAQYVNDNECGRVISGHWRDPYTGNTIHEVEKINVDHRISLQEAHAYGASSWPRNKRALFANTPANLVVVSKQQKQDRENRSASEWMPPNQSYWCDYVVRREIVARKFKLHLPDHEQDFNRQIKNLYCKY